MTVRWSEYKVFRDEVKKIWWVDEERAPPLYASESGESRDKSSFVFFAAGSQAGEYVGNNLEIVHIENGAGKRSSLG